MKKAVVLALFLVVAKSAPASAYAFSDVMAWGQRMLHYKMQFTILLKEAQQNRELFQSTYKSLKTGDWRSLSAVDVLKIVESPWFDGVDGIGKIREATALTVLSVSAAQGLWGSIDAIIKNKTNPRYSTDPWYRRKVDSLTRQARRSRATRAAILRQLENQNRQLNFDLKRIDELRQAIRDASTQKPVNQAKLTSLSAELGGGLRPNTRAKTSCSRISAASSFLSVRRTPMRSSSTNSMRPGTRKKHAL